MLLLSSPRAVLGNDIIEQFVDEMKFLSTSMLDLLVTSQGTKSASSNTFRMNGQIPVAANPKKMYFRLCSLTESSNYDF
jgi:hypothetical protein